MSNTFGSTLSAKKIWYLTRQAVSGEPQDYTTGSIRKAVFMLSIPMILEMIMESVFAIVDLFFVGKLGKHAVSTVGLTESVITIIYSLAIGISMAATAIVARRVGEKNYDAAARSGVQAIILAFIINIFISIAGVVFAADILHLMGAETATIETGHTYTRLMMGGSMVIMLLFLINGIFRGAGNAVIAMKSLWLANTFNIILCPLLIYGIGPFPEMGLTGAAVATTTGRGIGVCYQLYHLFKGNNILKFQAKHFVYDGKLIRSIITIATPGTFQFIIGSCSWILLAKLVAETGHSAASAGYQTAIRIVIFFILPAWGMSNAAATLVGQNLGAKQPQRAAESVTKTATYNAIFMGVVSLLFLFGAGPVVSVFTQQAEVKVYAVNALRIISSGYIFYGIGMVMINAFNGAGDTWTPTWINLAGFWLFQIPFAYLLAKYTSLGVTGVFIAIPVTETLISITALVFFKQNRWMKKLV
jgi:putative MATE family efflux protein